MSAYAITIVSPPDYIHSAAFDEVAETLHQGFLALGCDCIRTTEINITGRQHIILGHNVLHLIATPLADDAIIYNLEQVQIGSPWFQTSTLDRLRRHTVWDYSADNALALAQLGIQVAHIMPIAYTPSLTRIPQHVSQDIDVLFIGSLNERRQTTLNRMHDLGLSVVTGFGLYGEERDALIARAKVILNHHFYDAKVLEMVRISYLLANHRTVLSEYSANPSDDAALMGAVAFAHYDDLPNAALQLVQNPFLRAELANKGFKLMQQRPITAHLQAIIST